MRNMQATIFAANIVYLGLHKLTFCTMYITEQVIQKLLMTLYSVINYIERDKARDDDN